MLAINNRLILISFCFSPNALCKMFANSFFFFFMYLDLIDIFDRIFWINARPFLLEFSM